MLDRQLKKALSATQRIKSPRSCFFPKVAQGVWEVNFEFRKCPESGKLNGACGLQSLQKKKLTKSFRPPETVKLLKYQNAETDTPSTPVREAQAGERILSILNVFLIPIRDSCWWDYHIKSIIRIYNRRHYPTIVIKPIKYLGLSKKKKKKWPGGPL